MPVVLVCPTCGASVTVERPPFERCPRCGSPIPAELQRSLASALPRRRPFALTFGMIVAGIVGAVSLALIVPAALDWGTYSINGETVSGRHFLGRLGALWGIAGLLCLVIAYGLFRERSWTRPLMLAFWVVVGLGRFTSRMEIGGPGASAVVAIAWTAFCVFTAGAYLYGNAGVVRYYRALARPY